MWRRMFSVVAGRTLSTGGASSVSEVSKVRSKVGRGREARKLLGWLDLDFNYDFTTTTGTVSLSDMGRVVSEILLTFKGYKDAAYQVTAKQKRLSDILRHGRVRFTDPATVGTSQTNALRTLRIRLDLAGIIGERYFDTAPDVVALEDLSLTRTDSVLASGVTLNSLTVDVRAAIFEWHKGHLPVQFSCIGKNFTATDRITVKNSDRLLQLFGENNADSFTASDTIRLTAGGSDVVLESIRIDDLIEDLNASAMYDAASDFSSSSPTILPLVWESRSRKGAGQLEVVQLSKALDNSGGSEVEFVSGSSSNARYVAIHVFRTTRRNARGEAYIREALNRDPGQFAEDAPATRKPLRERDERTAIVPNYLTPLRRAA